MESQNPAHAHGPNAQGLPWLQTGFVAIGTEDLAGLVDFYGRLLNQAPQVYQADRYGEFQIPGLRIALFQPRSDQGHTWATPIAGSLSLCLTVTDLGAAIEHCQQLQLAPSPVQTASHGQEFFIQDPLGNRILFYAPRS